jgi:hypothetical protein
MAAFDESVQKYLEDTDDMCRQMYDNFLVHKKELQDKGEEFVLEDDDKVLLNLIAAYGILYNRAIDAGWVKGVITDSKVIIQ